MPPALSDPALVAELRAVAHAMADAARMTTLRHFRSHGLRAESKEAARFDPVTIADRETEAAMRAVLAARRPEDAILGEEYAPTAGRTGLTWVIDPIDGTRSYMSGTPVWGVLIAVCDAGGPVYGLIDLPAEIFDEMIEEQRLAHCDMLPPEMLPGMVQAQILRDAVFARTILQALEQTGGPVVMITGNGHARRDRAIPAILGRVAPAVSVWALGQFEGPPDADEPFDATAISPPVPRDDPCLVFAEGQG